MENRTNDESVNFAKVFLILDAFSVNQPELGVREVATLTNLPSSTVGRIMQHLRDIHVLIQEPESRQYRLSSRFLRWAKVSQAGNKLRELGLPILKALNQATGETATLTVPQGSQRMVLERIETDHPMRYVVNPGDLMPLHSGASGKIFLAFMPEEERVKILKSTGMPAFTANTITDADKLNEELERIRQQGFAISRGERVADVASIAAPIRDISGLVIATINVSGPITRFNDDILTKYSLHVMKAAEDLSRALGYFKD